jgi:hypothetical protein
LKVGKESLKLQALKIGWYIESGERMDDLGQKFLKLAA